MKLSRLTNNQDESLDPHPLTVGELTGAGITYQYLSVDPELYEPAVATLRAERGYIARDEVNLTKDTPNLQAISDKFWAEHFHTEDEVRFVLSGEGIFDIRDHNDRWMRVQVGPGDLIVVPKDRYHRFRLTEMQHIRCVRLFQEAGGWTPVYRQGALSAAS